MKLPRNRRKFWLSILVVGFFFVVSVAVAGTVYVVIAIRTLPTPEQFSTREVSQSTKIYDRTGTVLLYEIHGEEKRTVIPYTDIPDSVKEATIALEDANFYTRPAIDIGGILRSVLADIRAGGFVQGASTITQQLARNVFLTPQKTITRKINEIILAFELESKYSKDQILDFYLNQIPYGSNAYGVEAASQTYFNKSTKDLTLAESAVLASLPQAPSYYSPWGSHVSELLARKDYALDRMAELGYITPKERDAAKAQTIAFAPASLGTIKAPHFALAVKDYLVNKYGEDEVLNGGLRVITTLDWPMQQIAEKAVADGVARDTKLYASTNGSLVAEDPKTGQILALVGSADYFNQTIDGNFDVALQGLRQPGSSLKPFAYMLAFEKGYSPGTIIFDVPTEFVPNDPNCPAAPNYQSPSPSECFHPQDFENFQGPIPFAQALAQSVNVAAVKVLYLIGLQNLINTLHQFGLTTLTEPWRYGLSLVLGGGEVKLIDMVGAYSTLATEGVHHDQTMVLEVSDSNGNVLESYKDSSARVVDPEYPRLISWVLSDTDLRAGLFGASLNLTVFPGRDVALKTGTTNDYRDAWAFGYTPSLTVGVWAGNSDNTPMQHSGTSILAAVPMWSAFLNQVLPNYPPELFTHPNPLPPTPKPMLGGSYTASPSAVGVAYPQIHNILYYVDKNDPLGPAPANPSDDTQFANWETGVLGWASQNIQNFSAIYNKGVPAAGWGNQYQGGGVSITNVYPTNGSFVSSPLSVRASVSAPAGLRSVEIDVNGAAAFESQINGMSYGVNYVFGGGLGSQNLITIKATDAFGASNSTNIIIYH